MALKEFLLDNGVWSYKAGVAGTVVLPAQAYLVGISCYSTVGGTIVIAGGDSITVPAGISMSIQPQGLSQGLTIVFTGTVTYVVEMVT